MLFRSGNEESVAPSAGPRPQEDPHQLFRLEQGARHLPVPPHRAVVAAIAAGVGHEDAEQPDPHAGQWRQGPDIDRPKCARRIHVPQSWRESLAVLGGQTHQDIQLLFQIRRLQHRDLQRVEFQGK